MENGTICGKVKMFLSSSRSIMTLKSLQRGNFSSSPVVKTSPSNAGGAGSIPGWGTKIPNAVWMRPKKKSLRKGLGLLLPSVPLLSQQIAETRSPLLPPLQPSL